MVNFEGTIALAAAILVPPHIREPGCVSAESFTAWYRRLIGEIGQERLESRNNRINPRVVKHQVSNYAKKLPHQRPCPPLRKSFLDTVVMLI